MSKNNKFSCASCNSSWQKKGETHCWSSELESQVAHPKTCPTTNEKPIIDKSFALYKEESEDAKIAQVAARVEALGYQPLPNSDAVNARWTRVEDTLAFAKLMDYKKIGIATCIGLLDETAQLVKILEAQGFEALSVCCKAGSIDKLELGLTESEKVRPNTFEPACNPIAQAQLLNKAGTDLNIIVGLCVGHDILFNKHSDAPVTTMVAKDRVTGHNPVSALYGQNFYYKRLQKNPIL